jgi:hypothetical protein
MNYMKFGIHTNGIPINPALNWPFYQTTRRYNPEDSHLRTHRRENLKS